MQRPSFRRKSRLNIRNDGSFEWITEDKSSFKASCDLWNDKPLIMASEEVNRDFGHKSSSYSVVYPLYSQKLILLIVTADSLGP